jgi:transposase
MTQESLLVMRETVDYVTAGRPLVAILEILNHALREMDQLFESIYEDRGRYSVPPEWLLRGLALQTLYGNRSERLLCEQLNYNKLLEQGASHD